MSTFGTTTPPEAGATTSLTLEPGQENVEFPAGFDIASAEYGREGADLVVSDGDGGSVVVQDYFAQSEPPTLSTPEGAEIDGSVATKLAGPMAPGQVAEVGSASLGEPIGQVDTVDGSVTVTHADGSTSELSKGDPVFEGDILQTGDGSGVGVVLADSSVFSLGESGRMVLDEMVYDPGAEEGAASFALLTGAATFVSGQIAKLGQDAMMVKTPVATIGIRGTKVYLETDGESIEAVNLPENTLKGESVGEIVLMTPDGEMLGTINHVGGGWQWSPSQSSGPSTLQISDSQVQAIVQETSIHLPQTLEERALEVMERLDEIRTEAALAREEGDVQRAEELELQANEMEVRVDEVLREIEDSLGYRIDFFKDEGNGEEDFTMDLENFDTASGPEAPPPGSNNNNDPENPFEDLFNQNNDPNVPNPNDVPPAPPGPQGPQGQSEDDRPVEGNIAQNTDPADPNYYEGVVVDGYVEDALVYVDANNDGEFNHNEDLNGNGILDEGEDIDQDGVLDQYDGPDEAYTFSDENGEFDITTFQSGPLRAVLGTDVTTGLDLYGAMAAPDGSTVISPLTTLVNFQMQSGIDQETAEGNIVDALGLPPGTDLLNTDPQAAAESGDVGLMAKSVMVASTLSQMSAALEAAGLDGADAMQLAIGAIGDAADGGAIDLTDADQLGDMLNGAVETFNAQQPEGAPTLSTIDPKIINGMSAANSQMESLLENFQPGDDAGAFLTSLADNATFAQGAMVDAIRADNLDQLPQSQDAFAYATDPDAPWSWAEGMAPQAESLPQEVREREPNHIDEPQEVDRSAFGMGDGPDEAVVTVTGRLGTYNTGNHQEYNDAFTFEVKEGESLSLDVDNPNVEMRIYEADTVADGYDHLNPPASLDASGLAAGTYVVMVLTEESRTQDFELTGTLDVTDASVADRFALFANQLPEQEQNYLETDGTLVAFDLDRGDFGAVTQDVAGITITGSLADNNRNEDRYNDAFQFDLAPGEWLNVSHGDGAEANMRFQVFEMEGDGVNTRLRPVDEGLSPEDGSFSAFSGDGGSYVVRIWSDGQSQDMSYDVNIAVGGERGLTELAGGEPLTDGLYWDPADASLADLFRIYANEFVEDESNFMKTDGTLRTNEIAREDFGDVAEGIDGVMITGSLANYNSNNNTHNDAFEFTLDAGEWVAITYPEDAPDSMRFQLYAMEDGVVDTESRPIEGFGPDQGTFATHAEDGGTYVLRVWSEGSSVSHYEVDVAIGSDEALAELTGTDLTDGLAPSEAVTLGRDVDLDGQFNIESLIGEDFGDLIIDGLGDDILTGGDGMDMFVFDMDGDTDVITDFDMDDVLQLIGEDLEVNVEATEEGAMLVVTSGEQEQPTRVILNGVDAEEVQAALAGDPQSGYSVSEDPSEGVIIAGNVPTLDA
ncbi:FecR domain-containing protein [Magnetospira sp. QH-2]|uniref:FecR domain-containing protein n=1 Tax=Magnetospira sp. (strain QH-2) TaxID=1288970 RepID=UPI00130EF104|nr:FecR domain-containing protein [Magnetospira sp. QH-2]